VPEIMDTTELPVWYFACLHNVMINRGEGRERYGTEVPFLIPTQPDPPVYNYVFVHINAQNYGTVTL
jgi:hypothetical protein